MYIDIVGERRWLAIREDMTVEHVDHRPYFYIAARHRITADSVRSDVRRGAEAMARSGARIDPAKLSSAVVGVEETDMVPIVWDERFMMYYADPRSRVYRVVCSDPAITGMVGRVLESLGYTVGAHNVRYHARISMDIVAPRMLGYTTPAIFFGRDRAVSIMVGGLKKLRGREVIAFDIEVESRGTFPRPGDPLLTISLYSFRFLQDSLEGDDDILRASRDVYVIEGRGSEDMVAEFVRYVARRRPVALVGWNSADFDIKYMAPFARGSIFATHLRLGNVAVPHIDLFRLRKAAGPSLGLRSHAAFALDDVAEDLGIIARGGEVSRIETSVDRSNMLGLLRSNRRLFEAYVRVDAVLTAAIAQRWLAVIYALALVSGISPTALQNLNTGQVYEYVVFVRFLELLGMAPTLRSRAWDFGKMEGAPSIYGRGKVLVSSFGEKRNVMVVDFASMYPTIMYWERVDPLSIVPLEIEGPRGSLRLPLPGLRSLVSRGFTVVLSEVGKGRRRPDLVARVATTDSVLAYPIANARFLRLHVKALKRSGGEDAGIFGYVDKALKIFINAGYGATSKTRGNLLNELAGAYVFYWSNLVQETPIILLEQILLGSSDVASDSNSVGDAGSDSGPVNGGVVEPGPSDPGPQPRRHVDTVLGEGVEE